MKAREIIDNLYHANVMACNVYPVCSISVEHDIKEAKNHGWKVKANCTVKGTYLYAQKTNVSPRFVECFGEPDVVLSNETEEFYYYKIED